MASKTKATKSVPRITKPVPRITIAMVTPFTPENTVDEDGLVRQVEWLKAQGIESIIPGGTTGEFAGMTMAERLRVLSVTRSSFSGYVFANVSACALEDSFTLTRQAVFESGASPDALLILPPYYHKPLNPKQSEAGVEAYFRAYLDGLRQGRAYPAGGAERSELPGVYLYTFPMHTQQPVTPKTYGKLCAAYPELLLGIKASGVDLDTAKAYAEAAPAAAVLVGNGHIQLACLQAGLCVVSGDCLPIASVLQKLCRFHERGTPDCTAAANEVQAALKGIWRRELDNFDEIPANKVALSRIKEVASRPDVRPPLVSVDSAGADVIAAVIEQMHVVAEDIEFKLHGTYNLD